MADPLAEANARFKRLQTVRIARRAE